VGYYLLELGRRRVPRKLRAMSAGAQAPGRVTLAGEALAQEPDEVCPTTIIGRGREGDSSCVVKPIHLREYTLTQNPGPPSSGVVRRVFNPLIENGTFKRLLLLV
jgi:hypothetical protein